MNKCWMKISRALVLPAIMALGVVSAPAADDSVVILAKNGTSYTTKMADVKKIALGETSLVLTTAGGDEATYAYADVARILVWAEAAGITDAVARGEIAVWPTVVTDVVNVGGAEPGTPVKVYALNGSLVASATASDGTLSVNVAGAPSGVCIVSIGDKSVKIIKK